MLSGDGIRLIARGSHGLPLPINEPALGVPCPGIKTHELIGQICMVGDGKKFLSALIVLDGDGGAEKWANENGIEYNIETMSKNEKVLSAIQDHVDQSNSKVANVQQIKKFTLLSNEWTDSSGELTPSLKLKRHVVTERYENEIEAMYEEAK